MTTIYAKTRFSYPNKYSNAPERLSIGWHFERVFWEKDYITIEDNLIPESKYSETSGKRLAVVTFDETKISLEDITYDLQNLPCHVKVLTNQEAIALMQTTTCTESPAGTFELIAAGIDEVGEAYEATYLTIA